MVLQLVSIPGAQVFFYTAGTDTALTVYKDAGLVSAHEQPVVADSNGQLPDIWLQAKIYKCVVKDEYGGTLYTMEPLYKERSLIIDTANPSTTHAGMTVWNTTDGKQYVRNVDNSGWYDQGPYSGAGNVATVAQQLTGTDNAAYSTSSSVGALWKKGTDVTLTSTTLTLPTTGGGYFNVAGAFNIASINSATDGRQVWLYHTVARTLTHSSNFPTLTGADMAMRVGDITLHIRDIGTAWRMLAHVRANDSGFDAKTAGYTGLITERDKTFGYTISSGATHALPSAATATKGFRQTIVNRAGSTANVTIDPSGAETLDGLTTRILYPGDWATVVCDGTNWVTEGGNGYKYISGEITITSAAAISQAHGLARKPRTVSAKIICKTAESNYAVGDEVEVALGTNTTNSYGIELIRGTTNITGVFGSRATVFAKLDKTTGTLADLTNANWRLIIEAEE
jgi:hypothetical protein